MHNEYHSCFADKQVGAQRVVGDSQGYPVDLQVNSLFLKSSE